MISLCCLCVGIAGSDMIFWAVFYRLFANLHVQFTNVCHGKWQNAQAESYFGIMPNNICVHCLTSVKGKQVCVRVFGD